MAQVTFGTPAAQRHIQGDIVTKIFVVSGASGSTLPTGQSQIYFIDTQPFTQAGTASLITGITSAGNPVTLTLTSSSTMVNEVIRVMSREG